MTRTEWASFVSGIASGLCILGIAIMVLTSVWGESTTLYREGYYQAYKQFKQERLEQSAPKEIRLRYDTELLKEKYK